MPNIISLPSSISSPTGVRLFRGRKHGLLTLAGRFNVDEKNLLPRGRNKRKIRIKQRRNWCINHWSLQCCFTNPWRKAGRRKVWPCPPCPQVVLFFLTTDHSNASLFLSVGASQNPSTTQSVSNFKRYKLQFFRRSHVVINSNWLSEYHPCFPIDLKNEDSLFKTN